MATDQLINKAQGDAIISGLTAIKNAINDQPVPTQVEDVVADAFDVGVSYVPGDYCIHENKLYVCDVAHHGAWDGNDFTLTTVGAVLESLNNDLSTKLNASRIKTIQFNSQSFPANTVSTINYVHNAGTTKYTVFLSATTNVLALYWLSKTNNSVSIKVYNSLGQTVAADIDVVIIVY